VDHKNISIRDPLNTKPREIPPKTVTHLRQLLELDTEAFRMLKHVIRNIIPFGLIEGRRMKLRLRRLGLPTRDSKRILRAAEICRYELWPLSIRHSPKFSLIDVGANNGDFIEAVQRLVEPHTIIAIEPQSQCCELLRHRFPKVQVIEAALGASDGIVQFHRCGDDKLSSVLRPALEFIHKYPADVFKTASTFSVVMRTLDAIVPVDLQVSLLKIDVQGLEQEVLFGASDVLKRTRALLLEISYCLRYDGDSSFTSVHRMLDQAKFRLCGVSPPFFAGREPVWADAMYVNTRFPADA
jgi:FkbM family methyltransferase